MSRGLSLVALAILIVAGTACPFRRAPRARPGTAAVHAPSGMTFPAVVAGFEREADLVRYDAVGRDVSAGYSLRLDGRPIVEATVYVYPAPATGTTEDVLAGEMARVVQEIASSHPGAQGLRRGAATHVQGAVQIAGLRAMFRLPTTAAGALTGYTLSDAQLFAYQGWFIKYRITTLENDEPQVAPHVSQFLEQLRWPDTAVAR